MANLSTASGTITLKAPSRVVAEELIKMIELHDDYSYGTRLNDDPDFNTFEDGSVEASVLFDGDGRWCYLNNIEAFVRTAHEPQRKGAKIPDWELLEASDWNICFDYVDDEPGCSYLTELCVKLQHKAGKKLPESVEMIQGDQEFYEYTWVNLMKVANYELCDVVNSFIYYGEEPEEVYDTIQQQKEGLEEYYGKTLEEIFKPYPDEWQLYLQGEKLAKGGDTND